MHTILYFRPKAVALLTTILLVLLAINGCKKHDNWPPKKTFLVKAWLNGSNEVPPNASKGTGILTGTYNSINRSLSYKVAWAGLTGPAMAAHFQGPAAPGVNAGVQVPITGFPAGAEGFVSGNATLTEAQATDLQAGKWYINLHTVKYPGGEIRGQVSLRAF